jgi:hypothetical protein
MSGLLAFGHPLISWWTQEDVTYTHWLKLKSVNENHKYRMTVTYDMSL